MINHKKELTFEQEDYILNESIDKHYDDSICKNCGANNQLEDKYCVNCGEKICK